MSYTSEQAERAARPLRDGDEPVSYEVYHAVSRDAGDIDPGYELLRYVCRRFELNEEQRYWLAFLYATCYCAPTVFYIYNEFPDFATYDAARGRRWWAANKHRLIFQTDRKWIHSRNQWADVVDSYRARVGERQAAVYERLRTDDAIENYRRAWSEFEQVYQFGRFAMFLYTEAVQVVTGWPMRPDTLEMAEAESCRNGLCYAIGREDLLTTDERKPSAEEMKFLQAEFDRLAARIQAEDGRNSVWNIETTLCAYKKYRLGKRYVGYYLERQRQEIERLQERVPDGVAWRVLWDYRRETYQARWLAEAKPGPAAVPAAVRLRVVAIGGEPATGKTTIMRRLRPGGEPFQHGLLRGTFDRERRIYWLGIYDGDTFDGTDRLSMAVQPDAEQFIEQKRAEAATVVFEGDRLFRQAFLRFVQERADLQCIVITASAEAKAARHAGRDDDQSAEFKQRQATKVQNIITSGLPVAQLRHDTEADTEAAVAAIEQAIRGEAVTNAVEFTIHCAHDEVWPLAKFKPNPANANVHPPEQLRRLGAVLRANGWRMPITVSLRSGLVTKGHGRLAAALIAGAESAPMEWQNYASEAEETRDMIADNRLFELGETDEAALTRALQRIDGELPATGYSEDELARLLDRVGGAAPAAAGQDAAPPLAPVEGRQTIVLHYTEEEHAEMIGLLERARKRLKAATASDAVRLVLQEEEA